MRILSFSLLVLAMSQLGGAAWIHLKAEMAQVLIARAWAKDGPARPWPWADTWPVARLQVPERDVDLYVLAGDTGNSLAFGPGHLSTSAGPGEEGVSVISGHRDTHFAFLQLLEQGDQLWLTDKSGQRYEYTVSLTRISDIRQGPLQAAGEGLVLVTCYPFDAIRAGGPLRFLVLAQPV
ncbi:MAG: class GN sortase [Halieaceae bacterium]